MLRCNCKKYRASFRLCLFCYCFCRKRSIAPLLSRAFLPESPMALHGAINVHLIFAHYLYRASYPIFIHRTFAPAFCYLFLYHQIAYVAKCENFESSICAIHDALLFFIQVIHHIPIESCICNNHDHYVLLAFIVHLLILNIQLATYAQKYENSTMLTHSLDYIHQAPSIF